jgi:hypothetical protein
VARHKSRHPAIPAYRQAGAAHFLTAVVRGSQYAWQSNWPKQSYRVTSKQMKLYKPLPILVKWHYSKPAAFIRRHQGFFGMTMPFVSPYITLMIYIPVGVSVLSNNRKLAVIVIIFSLVHLVAWTILETAAITKPPEF